MLRFFQKIRKNLLSENLTSKPASPAGRYILYAVGEILLVMIGILLALQVNNWNEKQKQIKELKSYTKSLSSDLVQDIEMVFTNIRQGRGTVMKIDSLRRYAKDKELHELSNLHLWLLTRPLDFRPYRWHRSSLDELENSGALRYMKDDTLIQMIADYEAFTRHMDEDYNTDKLIRRDCEEWRNQIVDQYYTIRRRRIQTISSTKDRLIRGQFDSIQWHNYSTFSLEREPDFERHWVDISSDSLYQVVRAENRLILAKDVTIVHSMVNCMQVYRDNIRTRSRSELPDLIDDAKAIIERLNQYRF